MEVDFDNVLIEQFGKLVFERFKVNFAKPHIFVCGGKVDPTCIIPPSFRDRFLQSSANTAPKIHDAIVLAENFKDYFKENNYDDLLIFEDEIANIASLVMIFLESPGSLVELGMFCSRPNFYKKLLVIAAQDQIESEDSFIYLGPLEHIKKQDNSSVLVYPWPSDKDINYDDDYLVDLLGNVEDKLRRSPKTSNFSKENSAHVALLILEIVRLSYPITISEIEISLAALDLDISEKDIKRHIYLLTKMQLLSNLFYSSYRYYYPLIKDLKYVSFGKDRNNKISDSQSMQMSINQSYIMENSEQARKRKAAKKQINSKLKGTDCG